MQIQYYRNLVIINGLVPLAVLSWDAFRGQLGANAVNNAIHITGIVSLVFLFLSLIITPLRVLTGWNSLIAYRRALGLYGFAYAALHLLIYFGWDRMGSITSTFEEIASRRFLTVGFIAVLLMVPLAITSTNNMIRRMGPARWKLLHRLTYVVVILGVLHYYMLVKSDVRQPLAFAVVLTPILGFRAVKHYVDLREKARRANAVAGTSPTTARTKFFTGPLTVANIKQETHDVKTFRFVDPQGGEIPFTHKPGQYMTLQLDIDGRRVRRSYTLASAPSQRGYVELTIKRNPEGLVSRFLHDRVHVGDMIQVGASAGKFWFDGTTHPAVLLIAGGVGITPVMSMLRYLTDRGWHGNIHFLNAVRSAKDFIFFDELRSIVDRHPNVTVATFFSQDAAPPKAVTNGANQDRWLVRSGYINASEIRALVPRLRETPVYLCGPEAMMRATREMLAGLGLGSDQVFTEEFVSPASAVEDHRGSSTIESENHSAVEVDAALNFVQSMVEWQAPAGQTVLEAAEAAGVTVNWECRSGICGQCKLRCTSGRVVMQSTDALSGSEQKDGWILACQAKAASPSLQLEA